MRVGNGYTKRDGIRSFWGGVSYGVPTEWQSTDERKTIHEALKMLEKDGFVEVRKHKDKLYDSGPHPRCLFLGPKLRKP